MRSIGGILHDLSALEGMTKHLEIKTLIKQRTQQTDSVHRDSGNLINIMLRVQVSGLQQHF